MIPFAQTNLMAKAPTMIEFYRFHHTYPRVFVISGPSGVGKDTVVQSLLETTDEFHFVVTATSRPPRPGEIDGTDYIFVSEEAFEEMIAAGELLEYAVVHDNYKGVPKQQIRDALASGKDVLMRVDPQGAATLKRLIPEAIFIFLMAESEAAIRHRLIQRDTESTQSFDLRIKISHNELQRVDEFDYCVINRHEQLPQTIQQIQGIITAERCRTKQTPIAL